MSTLILDGANLELRTDGRALALYENGERRSTIALKLIERMVIQGSVKLDAGVLARLGDSGITTVILSPRQSRQVAFVVGAGHADASIRVAQYQLLASAAWCDSWAARAVRMKVHGQRSLLQRALEARPDCRKPLSDAIESLDGTLSTLRGEIPTAARARGLEGAAAAAYFRGLTAIFPDGLAFTGRNRRPPRDPVNACLSLGYTLLHFEAVRACHVAGLDPLLGFYHQPVHGRESMACDLVEALRPRVDAWVWAMFRGRELDPKSFVEDKGACLLGKAGRAHFYASWEAHVPPWRRHLRRECAALVRVMRRQVEPLPPAETEEL